MVVCALFYNGWSIERCIEYFELSSKIAFDRRRTFKIFQSIFGDIPGISTIVQFLLSMLSDSKYSADNLEMILQDVYGQYKSLSGSTKAVEMGTMLGVTLTSASDTSTYIATNYNGVGHRPGQGGTFNIGFEAKQC